MVVVGGAGLLAAAVSVQPLSLTKERFRLADEENPSALGSEPLLEGTNSLDESASSSLGAEIAAHARPVVLMSMLRGNLIAGQNCFASWEMVRTSAQSCSLSLEHV